MVVKLSFGQIMVVITKDGNQLVECRNNQCTHNSQCIRSSQYTHSSRCIHSSLFIHNSLFIQLSLSNHFSRNNQCIPISPICRIQFQIKSIQSRTRCSQLNLLIFQVSQWIIMHRLAFGTLMEEEIRGISLSQSVQTLFRSWCSTAECIQRHRTTLKALTLSSHAIQLIGR